MCVLVLFCNRLCQQENMFNVTSLQHSLIYFSENQILPKRQSCWIVYIYGVWKVARSWDICWKGLQHIPHRKILAWITSLKVERWMLFWIPSLFEIFTRNTTFFTALLARWWFSQLSQTSFTFKVKLIFCCENVLKSHLFIRSSFIYNPFLYNLQYAKENCMLRGIFQEQTIRKSRATPLFPQHKYMILFLPPPPHHQITRIFLLISQLTATTT